MPDERNFCDAGRNILASSVAESFPWDSKHSVSPVSVDATTNASERALELLSPSLVTIPDCYGMQRRYRGTLLTNFSSHALSNIVQKESERTHVMRQQYWSTVLEPRNETSCNVASARRGDLHLWPGNSESVRASMSAPHKFYLPESSFSREKQTGDIFQTDLLSQSTTSLLDHMKSRKSNASFANFKSVPTSHDLGHGVMSLSSSAPGRSSSFKRFHCQLCGSTFAQRGDLVRHIRVKGK